MNPISLKILALSGSTRSVSTTLQLLKNAAKLAPEGIEVVLGESLALLPHFNPELDGEAQNADVVRFRQQLREADAVLIATPEYAHGVPGTLKNALDWVVSSGEFYEKPVAMISSSPSGEGGEHALASLLKTLTVLTARFTEKSTLSIPMVRTKMNAAGEVTDENMAEKLREMMKELVRLTAH